MAHESDRRNPSEVCDSFTMPAIGVAGAASFERGRMRKIRVIKKKE
jgi:hypothetical protein